LTTKKCLGSDVITILNPDRYLSASDVKDAAVEFINCLPLPGVGGHSPIDPGDIWLVVILACVNQTSMCEGKEHGQTNPLAANAINTSAALVEGAWELDGRSMKGGVLRL
jgi:hypothetical protein